MNARENLIRLYEPLVYDARARLVTDARLVEMLDPNLDPLVLQAFLIHFSSLGVKMTEPVDGWIRRAGERCIDTGMADLGSALLMHAKHEAGHHLMLLEDARHLVNDWNSRQKFTLDLEALTNRPPTEPMKRYAAIHEDTIAGDTPYAQLAIETEVEAMSVSLGPRLVDQCKKVLGAKIVGCLSFVTSHVELDVGHTHFNENQIEKLLSVYPDTAPTLARTGAAALWAYIDFLGECLVMGRETVAQANLAGGHL